MGDIKRDEDSNIWFIDLIPHEDRRLKGVKSKRQIPLNNVLLHKLGFLDFINSIR